MRLLRHHRQDGRELRLGGVGVGFGGDFGDAGVGGRVQGRELEGLGAEFLVGEVGEGGVEEEGEDLGEGGGVDEVGCFVEEAAERWG